MIDDLCVEVPQISTCRIRLATSAREIGLARQLRREVFCREQRIFSSDDHDEIDATALVLVAVLEPETGPAGPVVGTVRIHESEPGIWYGSRLAVHAAYRNHRGIGSTLIRLAVSTAHGKGCKQFLAHVQLQNVPMFERLHWTTVAREDCFDRPHHLMQADLTHYPPCVTPRLGYVTGVSEAR
ncbi:MSMEG_0567/Sll0786 family nitrogen starvation N-acetyltransferase [Ralstonia mojiangensis]|uniref:MSMEG_0567/Sll0786 family nitrogen starvation N-acetyltransferase n=1 Tax=Ralstonia mojiangensis TaxID=2953895 RepID=UPI0021B4A5D8|nr:MSMEG_0567/Sll0786 family nitrogen starvation N-acetyltransferase [Ralstonia mojiangensis]MCT7327345.1 GNAT family N-acetyltransferase [Ralstonia mojiangensis]